MPIIKYIFLGFIQGLTEFLPVSSSAHLVILQDFLKIEENQLLLDIVLHLGTLLALVVFLFKDIKRFLERKTLGLILLATALTAVIVILGKEFFEKMFLSSERIILPLIITGIFLLCTKRFTQSMQKGQPEFTQKKRRFFKDLNIGDAFYLGIMQGFSVIPGLSRSGITISSLLFRNVEREIAFKFSFLASILAILGALFLKFSDFARLSYFELRYMIFGLFASFLSGLLALKILLAVIRKSQFYLFGYYCLALALTLWILI